ncbi:MAG: hypothetical protein V3U80_09505 [Flavobacteriaceae bacterium]
MKRILKKTLKMKINFLKTVIIIISILSLTSCSSDEKGIEIEKNNFYEVKTEQDHSKNSNSNLILNLNKENQNENFVKGDINFNNEKVNVKMFLDDSSLNNAIFTKLSDNELEIENLNGYDYNVTINNIDEDNANITFAVEDNIFTINAKGEVDIDSFLDLPNLSSSKSTMSPQVVCGGLCIGAIVTIVGGGYCAWRTSSLSSDCVSAYNSCNESNNGGCSYEFESSGCGGDCNINPPNQ